MKSFIEIKGKGEKRATEKEKKRDLLVSSEAREWKWVELVLLRDLYH